MNLAGLGWRAVFFVNVLVGLTIVTAAARLMPTAPRRPGARLDVSGALALFVGLLCLIGPLLFGHELRWSPLVWLSMMIGVAIVASFVGLERRVAAAGGMPLIDLSLLADTAFMRGLCAVFFFFLANLSFYLVMTLFMQNALHFPPLQAGLAFLPLALAFVIASRHSGVRARHRGTLVLIEGCAVQVVALATLGVTVLSVSAPSPLLLALPLAVFGYGQGLVMAPLSSAVLSTVQVSSAGSGAGMYGTMTQIANAAGVAAIGAVYFAIQSSTSAKMALLASFLLCVLSIANCTVFLLAMRRTAHAQTFNQIPVSTSVSRKEG